MRKVGDLNLLVGDINLSPLLPIYNMSTLSKIKDKVFPSRGIHDRLDAITERLDIIMATLEQVLQSVTEGSTVDDSIIALLVNIKTQLDAVLSGEVLAPAVQAQIDEIFAIAEADKVKVAEAVLANTDIPEEPVDPVEDPVE